jgi:hypothetical protein
MRPIEVVSRSAGKRSVVNTGCPVIMQWSDGCGCDATLALRYTVLHTSEKVPGTGVVDVIDEPPRNVADT